jgi:hypothetical protein
MGGGTKKKDNTNMKGGKAMLECKKDVKKQTRKTKPRQISQLNLGRVGSVGVSRIREQIGRNLILDEHLEQVLSHLQSWGRQFPPFQSGKETSKAAKRRVDILAWFICACLLVCLSANLLVCLISCWVGLFEEWFPVCLLFFAFFWTAPESPW